MNAASAGKWAAAALFSFVAVIILISAAAEFSKQRREKAVTLDPNQFTVLENGTVPEATWVDPANMSDPAAALAGSEQTTWYHVDPKTGRVEYKITAERVDPEEGGRILLTQPRARIVLGERVVRVTAANGELVKPQNAEPESGTLSGGVELAMFDVAPGEDPAAVDLEGRTPVGTLRTGSLSFESALGQISTEDPIDVESEGLSFKGRGLTLRVGELERGQRYRLNVLRIEESGGLIVRPDAFDKDSEPTKEKGEGGGKGGQESAPSAPGVEDFYRATIQGGVRIAQGEHTITSERLTMFARLLDGKLAPGAILKLALPERDEAAPGAKPRALPEQWSASFEGGTTRRATEPQDAVAMTWSGPLEIRPEKERPAELARDDVLVSFASPKKNAVEVADGATGASARCASLMYAMTTGRLILSGSAPGSGGVMVSAPGVGDVTSDDLQIELKDLPRGTLRIASPGVARAAATPDRSGGTIRWKDSAEIGFEVERHDGSLGVGARSIAMHGDVHAEQGANTISASFVQAEFRERSAGGSGEGGVNALSRLYLEGNVRGASEDGGSLVAEQAEVEFGGTPERPVPVEARAHGAVRVERAGDWLTAEHVDTTFATDADGRLRVSKLDADTGVALGSARGLGATTEQLKADLDHQIVELSGDESELSYQKDETRYALHSSSMRLDGNTRRLVTFGRGNATYRLAGTEGVADSGRMEWTGGMYYDDIAGTADMLGDVVASRVPGPMERQHAEAGQVRISLTPWKESGGDDVEQRRLLAIDLEGGDDAKASLELRRYREGKPDEAALETLVALKADTIKFDAVGEVLSAPDDGLLLVEDRRKGEVREGDAASDIGKETEVRGTTAFQWKDGLTFTRPTGEAVMRRDVRVRHMGLETGRVTQLECESLHAHFRKPGEEQAGASPLLSVDATDAVYLHHGTIEVVCDGLSFDAIREQIEASASEGNRVTVLDSADGRHFTAGAIDVDLKTGQWRAVKATGLRLSR